MYRFKVRIYIYIYIFQYLPVGSKAFPPTYLHKDGCISHHIRPCRSTQLNTIGISHQLSAWDDAFCHSINLALDWMPYNLLVCVPNSVGCSDWHVMLRRMDVDVDVDGLLPFAILWGPHGFDLLGAGQLVLPPIMDRAFVGRNTGMVVSAPGICSW